MIRPLILLQYSSQLIIISLDIFNYNRHIYLILIGLLLNKLINRIHEMYISAKFYLYRAIYRNRYSDTQYSDTQYSDTQHSDTRHSNSHSKCNKYSNNQHSNNKTSTTHYTSHPNSNLISNHITPYYNTKLKYIIGNCLLLLYLNYPFLYFLSYGYILSNTYESISSILISKSIYQQVYKLEIVCCIVSSLIKFDFSVIVVLAFFNFFNVMFIKESPINIINRCSKKCRENSNACNKKCNDNSYRYRENSNECNKINEKVIYEVVERIKYFVEDYKVRRDEYSILFDVTSNLCGAERCEDLENGGDSYKGVDRNGLINEGIINIRQGVNRNGLINGGIINNREGVEDEIITERNKNCINENKGITIERTHEASSNNLRNNTSPNEIYIDENTHINKNNIYIKKDKQYKKNLLTQISSNNISNSNDTLQLDTLQIDTLQLDIFTPLIIFNKDILSFVLLIFRLLPFKRFSHFYFIFIFFYILEFKIVSLILSLFCNDKGIGNVCFRVYSICGVYYFYLLFL